MLPAGDTKSLPAEQRDANQVCLLIPKFYDFFAGLRIASAQRASGLLGFAGEVPR